jgi:hypothetical protein
MEWDNSEVPVPQVQNMGSNLKNPCSHTHMHVRTHSHAHLHLLGGHMCVFPLTL